MFIAQLQKRFRIANVPDRFLWRAELHLLYLAYPELCHTNGSAGQLYMSLQYDALWHQFLAETGK